MRRTWRCLAATLAGVLISAALTPAPAGAAADPGSGFRPLAVPVRLLDSRALADGETVTVPVAEARADATAVAVTLTAWSDQRTSLALARDAGGLADATVVDLMPGERRSVTAVVTLGADREIRLGNAGGATHASIDLLGQYDPEATALYTPADRPASLLDTRLTAGQVHTLPVRGFGGVPATATAVQLNVTAREGAEASSVEVYAQTRPAAYATLESAPYRVRNTVTVSAIGDDGAVRIRNDRGAVQVSVAVVGWYAPGSGSRYVPLDRPARLLDRRLGQGESGDTTAVPADATAAVLALTAAGDGSTSLSAGPAELGWSGLPSVDGVAAGATQTGVTVARAGSSGRLRIRNDAGDAQVTAMLAGYFVGGPPLADGTGSCTRDAEAGFTPLFDGRTVRGRGWRTAGSATTQNTACELTVMGQPAVHWYAAEHLLSDYTLRLDFRVTTSFGDSGVLLGFPDPGSDPNSPGTRGVEAQIRPSGTGAAATGALTGVAPPITAAERPQGEWNAYEIRVAGRRVTVRLNDVVVNDQVLPESRFVSPGHVGLQGGAVAFRNVRVRADQPAARTGPLVGGDGRCADVQFADPADGTRLTLFDCHGKDNQMFTLPGDGTLRVLGKCVDSGIEVDLATCDGLDFQQWKATEGRLGYPLYNSGCLEAGSDATAMLDTGNCRDVPAQQWTLPSTQAGWGPVLGAGGRCVDLDGYGRANGTAVQLWDCHSEWNQQVTVPGDGTLRISGKCLDGDGPATGDPGDQRVKLWECNGQAYQQFLPRPDGSLYYPLTGRCVDAPTSDNGAKLYLHACHGGANQRFALPLRAPGGALRDDPPARQLAWWPMDETSGYVAADASGMGHRADLTGNPTWPAGRIGNALSLDGEDDHGTTGSPVVDTTRSFSVAVWARVQRADSHYGVVAQDDARHSGWAIETSPDQRRWEFIVWGDRTTDNAFVVQADTRVRNNQWTHIAAVYDRPMKRLTIYIDGRKEVTTLPAPTLPAAAGPTTIGRTRWAGQPANFFPGRIDDLRLYEGILSDAEVAALAQAAPR